MGSFNILSGVSGKDMSYGDFYVVLVKINRNIYNYSTSSEKLYPISYPVKATYEDYGILKEEHKRDWKPFIETLNENDFKEDEVNYIKGFYNKNDNFTEGLCDIFRETLPKELVNISLFVVDKDTYNNLVEVGSLYEDKEVILPNVPKIVVKDDESKNFLKGMELTGSKFTEMKYGSQDSNNDILCKQIENNLETIKIIENI